MEEVIQHLIEEYSLPPDAFVYLDSISFQEAEAGISEDIISSDLELIASISSRYGDERVNVLRLLDRSMEVYLKKIKSNERQYCGSLRKLEHEEFLSARENEFVPLSLVGLQQRISDYWLSSSSTGIRTWGYLHRKRWDVEPYLLKEKREQVLDNNDKKEQEKHGPDKWALLFGDVT